VGNKLRKKTPGKTKGTQTKAGLPSKSFWWGKWKNSGEAMRQRLHMTSRWGVKSSEGRKKWLEKKGDWKGKREGQGERKTGTKNGKIYVAKCGKSLEKKIEMLTDGREK